MARWLKRFWERSLLKAEAWDYMTCKGMSEETFLWLMKSIREDARKLTGKR